MSSIPVSLEWRGQDLLIMRIMPGTCVTKDVVNNVFAALNAERLDGPMGVVLLLPDDLDFDPVVITTDHRKKLDPRMRVHALAVVATTMITGTMADLHFAYFPPASAVRSFRDLDEAIAWASQSGSQRSVA